MNVRPHATYICTRFTLKLASIRNNFFLLDSSSFDLDKNRFTAISAAVIKLHAQTDFEKKMLQISCLQKICFISSKIFFKLNLNLTLHGKFKIIQSKTVNINLFYTVLFCDWQLVYRRTYSLPAKGCKFWPFTRHSWPLSIEGSLTWHT